MRLSRRGLVQGAGAVGLGLLAGCGRWPGQAQPSVKVPRIGFLAVSGQAQAFLQAFRQEMSAQGYHEGRDIVIEARLAEPPNDRLSEFTAELIALPVDIIVAIPTPAALAAKSATSTIPIVIAAGSGDPVANGLVTSLARPGGNVTGLSAMSATLSGKRLELLREAAPAIWRVAIVSDSTNPTAGIQLRETQAAAQTLGLHPIALDLRGPDGLNGVFEALSREHADAVSVLAIQLSAAEYSRVAEFSKTHRLPSVFALRVGVDAGGLMAYSADALALVRRSASYVDKILKGSKPADLPVEQPTTFDFIINLQTAQALGLTIPHHVLLQSIEVLQ